VPRVPLYLQWSEEACFHLMKRGHNREPVFADDEDRRAFVELVARYRDRFGFRLLHYCLLSNHFHRLVKLPDPRQVSTLMAGLEPRGQTDLEFLVEKILNRHGSGDTIPNYCRKLRMVFPGPRLIWFRGHHTK